MTLQPSLEERATCHFISNYIMISRNGTAVGFMEFVLPLLNAEKTTPHYQYAFEACAMASLNNSVGNRNHFERLALEKYTKALAETSAVLHDPITAAEDATLASVLLLGLFECISAKIMGRLAWVSHLHGAIRLVKLRGCKQLETKIGVDMLIVVRMQTIIYNLSTAKPPMWINASWFVEGAGRDAHAAECQRLCFEVGGLRWQANQLVSTCRGKSNTGCAVGIVRRCQALDIKCKEWSENSPEHFHYKSAAWISSIRQDNYYQAEAYLGKIDVYHDFWISAVWNLMRCARAILHSIIVRCIAWTHAPVSYKTTEGYARAMRVTTGLVSDVIASVPFQLGWFRQDRNRAGMPNLPTFACGDNNSLKGLMGYFMAWPLAFIQSLDYLTDAQRMWVRGRLDYIGSQLGVRVCLILKQLSIRVPSMLICTDYRAAKPLSILHDFEKQLSAEIQPSASGFATRTQKPYHHGEEASPANSEGNTCEEKAKT
ncbi:hypothetical protein QQS21_001918 [Conoideocrella luteorostrata]|uniref:Uncharacterized protein n=1 Tax=Conoideocrella luteorostrata TaxID=1105319 RepID=A0AAJ0CW45_9HYPO|nr:hypothetical protein QQS21_001918 [Conoideocrella luteorostrata]